MLCCIKPLFHQNANPLALGWVALLCPHYPPTGAFCLTDTNKLVLKNPHRSNTNPNVPVSSSRFNVSFHKIDIIRKVTLFTRICLKLHLCKSSNYSNKHYIPCTHPFLSLRLSVESSTPAFRWMCLYIHLKGFKALCVVSLAFLIFPRLFDSNLLVLKNVSENVRKLPYASLTRENVSILHYALGQKMRAFCVWFSLFGTFEACNPYQNANPTHSVI